MPEISSIDISKAIDIGGYKIRNRAFLAPMSGITDVPFRKLAWKYGAGLVVSEMVASEAFVTGQAEMQLKVQSAGLPLHMVQLAGREAKWMAQAAIVAEANGANIIDINMGCPAKRVTTGYSGSALMRDLDHALGLIDAVVDAVKVPVTLKMRLGWDDQSLNAPELARRAQDAGVQMITVHGRTRCQFYKGYADWTKVAHVREATNLPLVVNGDILDRQSAQSALVNSGADAVMIGRGSYGAPWLAGLISEELTEEQAQALGANVELVIEHHEAMLDFYGTKSGVKQARKHLGWYLENLDLPKNPDVSGLKKQVMTSLVPGIIHSSLGKLYSQAAWQSSVAA